MASQNARAARPAGEWQPARPSEQALPGDPVLPAAAGRRPAPAQPGPDEGNNQPGLPRCSLNACRLAEQPPADPAALRPVRGLARPRNRRDAVMCPVVPDGQLPMPARPLASEMLASYLGRLAAANHLDLLTLLAILPRWLTGKITSHRARLPGQRTVPRSRREPAPARRAHRGARHRNRPCPARVRRRPARPGPRHHGLPGDAPPPAASPSRSRYTSPPVRWSAPGTACGFPGPASPSSTSPPAPRSSSPSTTPQAVASLHPRAAHTRPPQGRPDHHPLAPGRRGNLPRPAAAHRASPARNPGLNTPAAEHELTQAATYPGIIAVSATIITVQHQTSQQFDALQLGTSPLRHIN